MSDERITAVGGAPESTGELSLSNTLVPVASSNSATTAHLVLLEGAQPGRHWTLGAHALIGRCSGADILLEDNLVSREHVAISRDEAGWLARDLGSRNGTFVNGYRFDVHRLRFGDRLVVGQSVLLFAHIDPMHERLLERQKIEALGRLGAGIAHDLNNYFGAILAALEYLEGLPKDLPLSDGDVRDCMDDVRAATRRGAELTGRLLAFARRGGQEHVAVDLGQLAMDAVELARRTFDRSVHVEISMPPGFIVRGDRGRLHQVLMNLLVNARDAMASGGTVRIRGEFVPVVPGDNTGPRVRLVVEDTGIGMDADTRARLFEPFFTTKAPDKGTGLGMAIAFDVITSHGGTIECETEPGRGTTFTILLPAADSAGFRRDTRTPHESPLPKATQPGLALVVDDEPMVRRTMRRLLERAGLRVIEAADGLSAVDMARRHAAEISVLLMDLDMPELDGERATRAIHVIDPELPIVILSGLCDDVRRRRLETAGAVQVLQKPCDSETLQHAIRAAIECRWTKKP